MSLSRHPPAAENRLEQACPCGSGQPYGACCAPWHGGPQHLQAPTPEALMRSRYTAYVQERWDYLRDTWHPSTRPGAAWESEPGLRWLGLEVRHCEPGTAALLSTAQAAPGPDGAHQAAQAWVEFVARSKQGGRAHRLHERSRFVWEHGQWWYVDGEIR